LNLSTEAFHLFVNRTRTERLVEGIGHGGTPLNKNDASTQNRLQEGPKKFPTNNLLVSDCVYTGRDGGSDHMDRGLTSEASLQDLERLVKDVRWRGDEHLAVLLEGVRMYVSLGREVELLESMREFERELRPAVEGTPSAADLERLYQRDAERPDEGPS
jgi:hypothetical protein